LLLVVFSATSCALGGGKDIAADRRVYGRRQRFASPPFPHGGRSGEAVPQRSPGLCVDHLVNGDKKRGDLARIFFKDGASERDLPNQRSRWVLKGRNFGLVPIHPSIRSAIVSAPTPPPPQQHPPDKATRAAKGRRVEYRIRKHARGSARRI